jgi:hypothetical protein
MILVKGAKYVRVQQDTARRNSARPIGVLRRLGYSSMTGFGRRN